MDPMIFIISGCIIFTAVLMLYVGADKWLAIRERRQKIKQTSPNLRNNFTADELVLHHYTEFFNQLDRRIKEVAGYGTDCLCVGVAPGPSRDLIVRKMRERGFLVSLVPIKEWGKGKPCHGVTGGLIEFVEVRW